MARAGGSRPSRPRCATDHRRRRNGGLESARICWAQVWRSSLLCRLWTRTTAIPQGYPAFGPGSLKNIWLGNVGQIMTSYSGWNRVVPRFQTQPDFCKGHHQDLFGRTTQSVRFGCINRRNYKPKGLKYHQQLQ